MVEEEEDGGREKNLLHIATYSYTVCIRIAPACSVAQSVELIT